MAMLRLSLVVGQDKKTVTLMPQMKGQDQDYCLVMTEVSP